MAGLASNIPELVMLGFVLAKSPRVGFIVVAFTLHIGVMAFGIYSGLLPRDASGHATLPAPLVKLSTDLYACAGAIFLATGALMLSMKTFSAGKGKGAGFDSTDLYVIGGALLFVEVVAVVRLVKRFSGPSAPQPTPAPVETPSAPTSVEAATEPTAQEEAPKPQPGGKKKKGKKKKGKKGKKGKKQAQPAQAVAKAIEPPVKEALKPAQVAATTQEKEEEAELLSGGMVLFYGALGLITSVIGGHAVGDFADILVKELTAAGYSQMLGALILSIFACAGVYVMIATAHAKGMYSIALANVSGAVTQVPFVVMPISLILIAVFAQTGVTPPLPGGIALPIDLHTTVILFLAFPPMLILWKAIQDDGKVNWVETAVMIAIFGLTLYFLARHG